jgi:hypothetical protein
MLNAVMPAEVRDPARRWLRRNRRSRAYLTATSSGGSYWLSLLAILAVVAVAQRRLGPSSSATTSTTERALPS